MNKQTANWKIYLIPVVLGVVALCLDLATKAWAAARLSGGQIVIIQNFFNLRLARNTGAAFSIMHDLNDAYRAWILVGISFVAIIAMLFVFYPVVKGSVFRASMLALVFAGALGNNYERLVQGYVVDFFDFTFFGWRYPTFNVADICIDVGFALIVIFMFKDNSKKATQKCSGEELPPTEETKGL